VHGDLGGGLHPAQIADEVRGLDKAGQGGEEPLAVPVGEPGGLALIAQLRPGQPHFGQYHREIVERVGAVAVDPQVDVLAREG
jgi:hypothetical protein